LRTESTGHRVLVDSSKDGRGDLPEYSPFFARVNSRSQTQCICIPFGIAGPFSTYPPFICPSVSTRFCWVPSGCGASAVHVWMVRMSPSRTKAEVHECTVDGIGRFRGQHNGFLTYTGVRTVRASKYRQRLWIRHDRNRRSVVYLRSYAVTVRRAPLLKTIMIAQRHLARWNRFTT
jgi:hypothetical protein